MHLNVVVLFSLHIYISVCFVGKFISGIYKKFNILNIVSITTMDLVVFSV